MRVSWRDDRGSAVAEFTMVVGLLTVLLLSVMQLALALHVRNTVQDAAAEGARYASLVGNDAAEGVERTRDLITTAIGPTYAESISATTTSVAGHPAIGITVEAPLPLFGLLGPTALEVQGHAAIELLD